MLVNTDETQKFGISKGGGGGVQLKWSLWYVVQIKSISLGIQFNLTF